MKESEWFAIQKNEAIVKLFKKFRSGINAALEKLTQKELTEKKLQKPLYDLQLSLIQNNVAVPIAEKITKDVEQALIKTKVGRLTSLKKVAYEALRKAIIEILEPPGEKIDLLKIIDENKKEGRPTVLAIFGPNGAGKTTTIAKLTQYLIDHNYSVVIGAGDTFRAGAIDQISKHCKKLGVRIIKQDYGADPAAVIYDAINHAKAKGIDVVIADTAGRLQTNKNLMRELQKIVRVADPDLNIFVADALTGNDAAYQAEEYDRMVGIDASILTKVDADPKGGAALSIVYATKAPIIFIGIGQKYSDFKPFDPKWFAEAIIPQK
ncbi:MAG: signal recognition particle-docking protein FtsY [Candidatus Heimdallarchaeota archaeon]|nr:signal recognition particle-docking protein FtsY [Candidatus Heimdallarchaeota archaeon]